MNNPYVIIIAIVCLYVASIFWIAYFAPKGYEDKDGFHYGDPPEDG